MTQDGEPTLARSLEQLLVLTEKAEQWQELLEESSSLEILGDLLLGEVDEGRVHHGAALGWILGARGSGLAGDPGDGDAVFRDERLR